MTETASETARRVAALSPQQREMLLHRLRQEQDPASASQPPELPRIEDEPDRQASVPLTDGQEAFWIGRSGIFDLGGSGANVYLEYEFPENAETFAERLGHALDRIIQRHEILRTIVLPDGALRLLEEVRPFVVRVEDLSAREGDQLEEQLDRVRAAMRYARTRLDRWPLFEVLVHQLANGLVRLHARFDALILDGTARGVLLTELALVLANLETALPALDLSFLDFARAVSAFRETATYQRDRAYWMERLPLLPPPPRLPLALDVGPDTVPRIVKRNPRLLEPEDWQGLKQRAAQSGLTPSGLLTAAFAESLRSWTERPDFTLGIVGAYQPDIHPHLRRVIGTFNTIHLLAAEEGSGSFEERVRRLQRRMTEDIDHQHFTGLRVLRELNRLHRSSPRITLPVLFDSVVEYSHSSYQPGGARPSEGDEAVATPEPAEAPAVVPPQEESAGEAPAEGEAPAPATPIIRLISTEIDLMISLPQVLLLFVVLEEENALNLITQAVEEVLPESLVPGLIEDYRRLLARLATDPASWQEERPGRQPAPAPAASETTAAPPLSAFEERLGLGSGDRVLAVAPWETMPALPSGAALLAPVPAETGAPWDPAALAGRIARESVTACLVPPALLEAIVTAAERDPQLSLRSLRLAILWGEAVPAGLPSRLQALSPEARMAVAWFHPETGAPAAASILQEGDAGAPVRVESLPGHQLLVLDGGLAHRPAGVAGDLHVTCGGISSRTGQRARCLEDGRIEVLDLPADPAWPGRLGHGTDLQRLEAALQQVPGLRHAVVERQGDRLTAWIVPFPKRPSSGDTELRRHLRASFPEHRVPTAFVRLEHLPLTRDGRVDREALPAAAQTVSPAGAWSTLETELAGLWEEVLGRRPESRGDDFFDLGGTSLSAARLLALLAEKRRIQLPAAELFARPTVTSMAEILRGAEKAARAPLARRVAAWPRQVARRLTGRPVPAASPFQETETADRDSMRIFMILWFGQLVSGLGTGLGTFSLGVWIYQQNMSATQFTLVGFCAMITGMLMMPVAGSFADRYDRRKLILYGDAAAAFMTLLLAIALYTNQLRVWHVFPLAILMTAFGTLQGPALFASISTLVSRRQLIRAGTLSQLIGTVTAMTTPLLAGVLVGKIGFHGVILIDFSTFFVAAGTLLYIRFPTIQRRAEDNQGRPSVLRDLGFGWAYLRARPGLLDLLILFTLTNFSAAVVQALLTPLILSFATPPELGTVGTAAAVGGLLGSLLLSAWGGPRQGLRVWAIFWCMVFQGSLLFLGGVEPSIPLIAAAMFLAVFTAPIVGGASTAIWQSKVAHDVQGRLFGLRGLVSSAAAPIAFLLSGFLADRVFEPLLKPGGALAGSVGQIIGVGRGRGIGFLYILLGLFTIAVMVLFFLKPRLRNVESELPDMPRPGLPGTVPPRTTAAAAAGAEG